MKNLEDLTSRDLEECPVWEFVHEEESGGKGIFVRPVRDLPISHAQLRLIGTKVAFHNGASCWALLGNIDLTNLHATKHFLSLSLERDGRWFHLARYHDSDYATRGPESLAKFLGRSTDDIFPISYDVSAVARGLPEVISGRVAAEMDEKLSESELISLALS